MLDLSAEAAAPSAEKTDVAISEVNQQQAEKEPGPEEKPVEKEPEPEPEPKKVEQPQKAEIELPQPKPVAKPPRKKMAALNTRQLAADKESTHAISPNPGMMGRMNADYGVAVSAHLNRYKNVPRGLGEGGTVNLSFTLDRHGHVLSSRITRGSGTSELDREALDMLRRAQPFPTPPADLAGAQFPFTVPVRYSVR
jgi:protein TonB